MSPKWTVRQKALLQAAWKPCLCAEAEGCAGGCNPPSFVNHIIHCNTPNVRQHPPPPPPPSLPNDCYWKVFADDDDGPGLGDPCPNFEDRQKDSDEGEAPREASGPSDRNFGMFCQVKKPRQNRNRKERKKQQARSSHEQAPRDDEEVDAGAMSDAKSGDSLIRDLREIHGYYLEESEPERLPQSKSDAGGESDDGECLRSIFCS